MKLRKDEYFVVKSPSREVRVVTRVRRLRVRVEWQIHVRDTLMLEGKGASNLLTGMQNVAAYCGREGFPVAASELTRLAAEYA